MNELLIDIDLIDPNPYQPRQAEDSAVVQELAADILHHATDDFDGLMQAPTVRQVEGVSKNARYQLAFGHTRKAAFGELVNQGHKRYAKIRANVRELTDVQMFELAVAENIKRRDLNPIEQAEAMRRYMDEFHKTSVEAGAFFGVAEETVRAKVRLLNLPVDIQNKVRAGKLNENDSRPLLTLTRVLPNDQEALNDVVQDIENGEKAEEAVATALRGSPATKIIGGAASQHFSIKAKSFKYLPVLSGEEGRKILGIHSETVIWDGAVDRLYKGDKKTHQDYFADEPMEPDALAKLDKLAHLIKPPACTACPLFAQVDGMYFCGWAPCFDRKKIAGEQAELHRVSEEHGIAVYDAEADGKCIELNRWDDKHKKLFEKKHEDLRLKVTAHYNNWPNIPNFFAVVVVGKTLEAWKKAEEKAREAGKQTPDSVKVDWQRNQAVNDIIDAQAGIFLWEVVAPTFSTLLDGVEQIDFLERLTDMFDNDMVTFDLPEEALINQVKAAQLKKPVRLALRRKLIIVNVFDSMTTGSDVERVHKSKAPITEFAKAIRGIATTWGVKLPKDFDKQASAGDEAVKLAIEEYDQSRGAK